MYLLFLDESGTHGGSNCLVVAGLAVHEDDARHLQNKIESFLQNKVSHPPHNLNSLDLELHATDIKNGNKDWQGVDLSLRLAVLRGAIDTLRQFEPQYAPFPPAFFGAVVDSDKVVDRREREKIAYELVLNKFDAMLGRINRAHNARQRGLVIHDQRVVGGTKRAWTDERRIQQWTADWRQVAGKIGQLRHFADIPLFADSQASRLIQGADFVAYALWRYYGPSQDDRYLKLILDRFDVVGSDMHGLIHLTRAFESGGCGCPPCRSRQSPTLLDQ